MYKCLRPTSRFWGNQWEVRLRYQGFLKLPVILTFNPVRYHCPRGCPHAIFLSLWLSPAICGCRMSCGAPHQTVGKYLLSGCLRAQDQTWKCVVGGASFDHRAHLGLKPRLISINADSIVWFSSDFLPCVYSHYQQEGVIKLAPPNFLHHFNCSPVNLYPGT